MYKLRVSAAIEHYNIHSGDQKTLTREVLAGIVLPDLKQKTAEQYLSSWNNGKKLSALKPSHIHAICEVTSVDANFLLGVNNMSA